MQSSLYASMPLGPSSTALDHHRHHHRHANISTSTSSGGSTTLTSVSSSSASSSSTPLSSREKGSAPKRSPLPHDFDTRRAAPNRFVTPTDASPPPPPHVNQFVGGGENGGTYQYPNNNDNASVTNTLLQHGDLIRQLMSRERHHHASKRRDNEGRVGGGNGLAASSSYSDSYTDTTTTTTASYTTASTDVSSSCSSSHPTSRSTCSSSSSSCTERGSSSSASCVCSSCCNSSSSGDGGGRKRGGSNASSCSCSSCPYHTATNNNMQSRQRQVFDDGEGGGGGDNYHHQKGMAGYDAAAAAAAECGYGFRPTTRHDNPIPPPPPSNVQTANVSMALSAFDDFVTATAAEERRDGQADRALFKGDDMPPDPHYLSTAVGGVGSQSGAIVTILATTTTQQHASPTLGEAGGNAQPINTHDTNAPNTTTTTTTARVLDVHISIPSYNHQLHYYDAKPVNKKGRDAAEAINADIPQLLWPNTSGLLLNNSVEYVGDSSQLNVEVGNPLPQGGVGVGGDATSLMPRYKDLPPDRLLLFKEQLERERLKKEREAAAAAAMTGPSANAHQEPSTTSNVADALIARLRAEGLVLAPPPHTPSSSQPTAEVGTSVSDSFIKEVEAGRTTTMGSRAIIEEAIAAEKAKWDLALREEKEKKEREAEEEQKTLRPLTEALQNKVAALEASLANATALSAQQAAEREAMLLEHRSTTEGLRTACAEASLGVSVANIVLEEMAARVVMVNEGYNAWAKATRGLIALVMEKEPVGRAAGVAMAEASERAKLLCAFHDSLKEKARRVRYEDAAQLLLQERDGVRGEKDADAGDDIATLLLLCGRHQDHHAAAQHDSSYPHFVSDMRRRRYQRYTSSAEHKKGEEGEQHHYGRSEEGEGEEEEATSADKPKHGIVSKSSSGSGVDTEGEGAVGKKLRTTAPTFLHAVGAHSSTISETPSAMAAVGSPIDEAHHHHHHHHHLRITAAHDIFSESAANASVGDRGTFLPPPPSAAATTNQANALHFTVPTYTNNINAIPHHQRSSASSGGGDDYCSAFEDSDDSDDGNGLVFGGNSAATAAADSDRYGSSSGLKKKSGGEKGTPTQKPQQKDVTIASALLAPGNGGEVGRVDVTAVYKSGVAHPPQSSSQHLNNDGAVDDDEAIVRIGEDENTAGGLLLVSSPSPAEADIVNTPSARTATTATNPSVSSPIPSVSARTVSAGTTATATATATAPHLGGVGDDDGVGNATTLTFDTSGGGVSTTNGYSSIRHHNGDDSQKALPPAPTNASPFSSSAASPQHQQHSFVLEIAAIFKEYRRRWQQLPKVAAMARENEGDGAFAASIEDDDESTVLSASVANSGDDKQRDDTKEGDQGLAAPPPAATNASTAPSSSTSSSTSTSLSHIVGPLPRRLAGIMAKLDNALRQRTHYHRLYWLMRERHVAAMSNLLLTPPATDGRKDTPSVKTAAKKRAGKRRNADDGEAEDDDDEGLVAAGGNNSCSLFATVMRAAIQAEERHDSQLFLVRNMAILVSEEATQRAALCDAHNAFYVDALLRERHDYGAMVRVVEVSRAAELSIRAQQRVGSLEAQVAALQKDLAAAINSKTKLFNALMNSRSGMVEPTMEAGERAPLHPLPNINAINSSTNAFGRNANIPIHERFARAHQEAMKAVSMQQYPFQQQ